MQTIDKKLVKSYLLGLQDSKKITGLALKAAAVAVA